MSGIKLGISLKAKKDQPPRPAASRSVLFSGTEIQGDHGEKAREKSELQALEKGKPKLRSKFGSGPPRLDEAEAQSITIQYGETSEQIDPSIYDYDAAYDAIHARKTARKAEQDKAVEDRKSRYIDGLMQSAETRKQSLLRAKEKMLQREREAEGDEFAEKEKFVTEAYRKQQEENRKLEEAESQREEEEAEKRRKTGATGFYKHVIEEREKIYREAAEAERNADRDGVPNLRYEREKSERELAHEARAKGRDVITNDEGEITDKRQLLSAGLNVVATPNQDAKAIAATKSATLQPRHHGSSPGQRDMRARQTRMLEAQLLEATKRAADDEMEEQRKLEHASKSRKKDDEITSAKERYLARKREAEAAKAARKEG